jgi:SAM-dependent methyltransferase
VRGLASAALVATLAGCSRGPTPIQAAQVDPSVHDAATIDAAIAEAVPIDAPTAEAVPVVAQALATDAYARRTPAPAMGFGGASWLDRPEREQTEQPEKALDALAIEPGMTVADVGAATGYFTLRIARRVGREGHVVATDLEPRMLAVLAERATKAHLSNIETRVVTNDDPRLDPGSLDLVLMVDVYHELAHPQAELAAVKRALRPGGRLALVEYRGEDPKVAIKPEHKMTRAQVEAEVLPAGYREVHDFELLRDQRILVFTPAILDAGG